ncbi:zinc finger protein 60-like [Armigeres subalbatus]|uniref:zinc finger protein 60-like n=1 Tax=Armigeres subalbatus TaxID=124917 RepID=UPI002ED526B5
MGDLDIENICRLCCDKRGRMRSLFEQRLSGYATSLQQIIFEVTRLEVNPADGLPQKICKICTTTLVRMHETIEDYRANDLKLRQQLGAMQLPHQVDIKEEEVDIEVLEKTCQQDMLIDNINIKPEPEEEEYLDYEQLDESNENESKNKFSEMSGSETDTADEGIRNDNDVDDEDWKPSEEDKEVYPKKEKLSVTKTRKKIDSYDLPKPVYKRYRYVDPNRPRYQDFKCYVCMSPSHGTAEALLTHMNNSHAHILPYTCPDCVMETIVIKTVMSLNHHKRQHLNPEKCPFCDRRYTSKNNVAQHVQMYHMGDNEPNPSPCEVCGKVCSSKLALKAHMRLHTSGIACEICGKVFQERHKLQRHIQSRHEKLRKFECHICKKKLSTLSAVQIHINTYHSNQEFQCSYCPKKFTAKLTHKLHEKKHVENRNYVATKEWKEYYTVCDGEEGKVSKLKKCNLCGTLSRNMGNHLSKVHFPTEYRCEICDTTFKSKQTRDAHVQEHEHGKAYQCPICGRQFSERRNLISHLRTKKHRDHPIAKKWLGSLKTAVLSKTEDSDEDQDTQENRQAVEGIESFM